VSAVGEERGAAAADAGDDLTTRVEPDRSWHGPASVTGSVVGSLGVMLMVALADAPTTFPGWVLFLLPWGLGVPLALVGRGTVRRFGVGVVASGLLLPSVPAMIWLASAASGGR
jgi:hypothetical protein